MSTSDTRLDVGAGERGEDAGDSAEGGAQRCTIFDDTEGMRACETRAPADSFDPEVQWEHLSATTPFSLVTPLVANLNDDNGDSAIDLCDRPDVVVLAYPKYVTAQPLEGTLIALDGGTGDVHFAVPGFDGSASPALGDIDGDGKVEIVGVSAAGRLRAIEHDGEDAWLGDPWPEFEFSAIALADLDADGQVEIIAGSHVFDSRGRELWSVSGAQSHSGWGGSATTAADLDGDGSLEVVMGKVAYHADGSVYFDRSDVVAGYPHVADFDEDPEPEIIVTNWLGITVLEADGTPKYQNRRPTGQPGALPEPMMAKISNWVRPGAVHDFDGDGAAEFAMSSGELYSVYEQDLSVAWSAAVRDESGSATGTAFDFLGDGVAEAIYGDEDVTLVFDGRSGSPLLSSSRTSRTIIEYPVVADVDNDGSAEIVITSSDTFRDGVAPSGFTVKVVRDTEDRWIQARRIWNQHTYHVTNTNEDGTIPAGEQPHWRQLNTFRTNAQIEAGGLCRPTPVG